LDKDIKQALIFGGSGGFGRAFAAQLTDGGVAVISADVLPGSNIQADILDSIAPFAGALADADLVLLCLPQEAALGVLKALDGHITDALVVDICSVKSVIVEAAAGCCTGCEYVSFHPMFGPDKAFSGSNGVFIPVRGGARGEIFKQWLGELGVQIIETDVETHDRVTSLVQVATHAVLATFANLREAYDLPEDMVAAFATPVFAELDRVSQSMVAEDPALYHNIQSANPWGGESRARLSMALEETLQILGEKDPVAMRALFSRIRRA